MNRKKRSSKALSFTFDLCCVCLLNLKLGKGENFVQPPFFFFHFLLGFFKSDENNIRRQAIHLFANRPISYLLFD